MNNLISQSLRAVTFAITILFWPLRPASADGPLPSTKNLEVLVSKWVELKNAASLEKTGWEEEEARLNDEIELLLQEKLLLEEEIQNFRRDKTALADERAELLQKKEALSRALDRTIPVLKEAEGTLTSRRGTIPPPLLSPLQPLFDRLEKASEQSISRRLQVIFSLFGEIEGLQNSIRVTREILPIGAGGEREFDVVYLGLARGFCVSEDDREAGIGVLTPSGWEWTKADRWAGAVRRAIDCFNREKTPEFIDLPIKLAPPLAGPI